MTWDISGSTATAAWSAEAPENLWIGHRDAPNQILLRDPSLINAFGAAASGMPGGHPEGFADTWAAFFGQVYADVARGGGGPKSKCASFEDGHYEMLFCDAVLASAATGAGGCVMQLGILTAPFADTPLEGVADWAASAGLRRWRLPAGPPRVRKNAVM